MSINDSMFDRWPRLTRRVAGLGLAAAAVVLTAAVGTWQGFDVKAADQAAVTAAPVSRGAALAGAASYAEVVQKVAPAVVTIRTERRPSASPTGAPDDLLREFFGRGFRGEPRGPMPRQRGLGSGVVVTSDGYLLTNNHVVEGAEQIRVELTDKRVFDAKLIGADPASDLAVVKIEASNLATLPLGDSDAVRVGDVVLAVGNPLGLGQTVTMGIVSAKGRATGAGDGGFEDFLQTDAPINQGNSGGALVDLSGRLVGINSQILSPSGGNIGLGFAIPTNMARSVMDQLVKDGKVHRARLGVTVQTITGDLANSLGLSNARGALISNVQPGSPADGAGIRQGDVITAIDGTTVQDGNELRNLVASRRPGSSVELSIVRDGKTQQVRAALEELPSQSADASAPPAQKEGTYGMRVEPVTPEMLQRLELPRSTGGLVVIDVDPSGPAAESGIQEGDVIERVNGKAVTSTNELRSALAESKSKPAMLLVARKGGDVYLTLRANS